MVTCPPIHAWAVYAVSPGHSLEQAARFFTEDHERELWQRVKENRNNWATGNQAPSNSGCAVVALAAISAAGAVAAAWARGRWGV